MKMNKIITKKVKLLIFREESVLVPVWTWPLCWLSLLFLSPLLMLLYLITLIDNILQENRRKRDAVAKKKMHERFVRESKIVEPIDVDVNIFRVQDTNEFERFCDVIADLMEVDRCKRGSWSMPILSDLLEPWKAVCEKLPHLSQVKNLCLKVNSQNTGAEVRLYEEYCNVKHDESAAGFAEKVVLRHLSDQLYLFWHALYKKEHIYVSHEDIIGVKSPGPIDQETKRKVDAFNFTPVVGKMANGKFACEYVVHRPYGDDAGLIRYRAVEDEDEPFAVYKEIVDVVSIPCFTRF